jgi:tRNA threonylcarbamoyladenosine biosynthesis protein TsaB
MLFAAFESSTEWCSVALMRGGELSGIEVRSGHGHSERILPMLDRLLAAAGETLAALQAVAYGAGPGAFTGLRIACGVAQGLAFARGIPALGVSTLEAMAEETGAPRVAACLDARMREVYFAALERTDGNLGARWREVIAPVCMAPADLPRPPGDGWVGCGSGFAAYGALGYEVVLPEVHPTAMAVARLAAPRLAAGEGVDAAAALPIYLREQVALTESERGAGRVGARVAG